MLGRLQWLQSKAVKGYNWLHPIKLISRKTQWEVDFWSSCSESINRCCQAPHWQILVSSFPMTGALLFLPLEVGKPGALFETPRAGFSARQRLFAPCQGKQACTRPQTVLRCNCLREITAQRFIWPKFILFSGRMRIRRNSDWAQWQDETAFWDMKWS